MKVIANCLVKNEENFIWYAINSVVGFVDEILVWDNGSTDKTVEIINSIPNTKNLKQKIKFERKGETDAVGTAKLRQEMLQKSDCDWLVVLDGDEIWSENSMLNAKNSMLNAKNKDLLVSPTVMFIGDIYHYQEERAGRYRIAARIGNYNIRFVRRGIPGLHLEGAWPNEAYVNGSGVKVQDFPEKRILFSDLPYLHASFLERSSVVKRKTKYEIGNDFPLDYFYPEVFFKPRPAAVPSPWDKMDFRYRVRANLETPLKKLKRRLW